MKYLYYNPIEVPEKIHIVSKAFGLDITYAANNSGNKPISFSELFAIADLECFDAAVVYLSPHEQSYYKNKKSAIEGFSVVGWVDLKDFYNGGGYLDDHIIKLHEAI